MTRLNLVFPIRFAYGNLAVQTTTRELSIDDVFIRCLEPPEPETALDLKLYLPGARQGLQVRGEARERSRPEEEMGFRAVFVELDDEARKQIGEILERRERAAESSPASAVSTAPEDDPRRAFPRYSANFAVRFATVQDFVLEYAANISAGGVFVHTGEPPPLKTIVRVEMELPGAPGVVPARGVVVHRVSKEEAEQRGTLPGMGVQFVDANDDFRGRIDAAIDHILKKQSEEDAA
jgi:uncharacterized protein (TIGR02266 family)